MSHIPIPESKSILPQCQVCKFQPAPQSNQHFVLVLLELMLIFISIKLAIILLFFGYSFSQTTWKCPMCTRQVKIDQQMPENIEAGNSIIIRMGKCIGMMSKNRFRAIAGFVICCMIYLIATEPSALQNKVRIEKTWGSLVQNCGYVSYEENSLKANRLYSEYIQSGNDWVLDGIYIGDSDILKGKQYKKLFIKMDPSQFADPKTADFTALIRRQQVQTPDLSVGDLVRVFGQWEGKIHHEMLFTAFKVQKLEGKKDPARIGLINYGNLRINSD